MAYYNTTNQSGEALVSSKKKATSQEVKILQLFTRNPRVAFSPSQVWATFGNAAPLTSIRRSITNLTKQGLIEKTSHKTEGLYGRDEYTWKLKSNATAQGELL